MFVNGSGPNVQSLERTFYSFSSFGRGVSEEKIKKLTNDRHQVMAKAHIAFGKVT